MACSLYVCIHRAAQGHQLVERAQIQKENKDNVCNIWPCTVYTTRAIFIFAHTTFHIIIFRQCARNFFFFCAVVLRLLYMVMVSAMMVKQLLALANLLIATKFKRIFFLFVFIFRMNEEKKEKKMEITDNQKNLDYERHLCSRRHGSFSFTMWSSI